MSSRSPERRRRAALSRYRIEAMESRALPSIAAGAFSVNVLQGTAATIDLGPQVQESDPGATVTYDLASTTTAAGGTVGVNPATGLVTYTPPASSPAQDSFSYFATDSDGDTSATETVTMDLASIAANPFRVDEVEGQATIGLNILDLPGAVQDVASKPSYTFSDLQVAPAGDGSATLADAEAGRLTYTPPASSFTGSVTISYQVTDGTSTEDSSVTLDIGPIAADPVVWGTLSSTTATVPSAVVPSLAGRIHDVDAGVAFTFSNPTVPPGEGSVSDLDAATGSFTYTAPDAAFTGEVPVTYTVSDGANATTGEAIIDVEPLVTRPVAVTELDHQARVAIRIEDLPGAVQDIASEPSYTFSDLRVLDGGGSVPASGFDDPTTGTFTYTLPGSASPGPVHIAYEVGDGTHTADGIVTLQLAAIVANAADYSILEGTSPTLPALAGRIDDVASSPKLTFSGPSVPSGDGTIQFTDTAQGILSYSPPGPTFTGLVPVSYTVSDGTNSTTGLLDLDVGPLVTVPALVPVALQTQPTDVPSLVAGQDVEDVASDPSYTFSDLVVPTGDGAAAFTDPTTGALQYTPPFSTFFGLVQLTYAVKDGAGNTASGTVEINVEQTIRPADDGPITAVLGRSLTIAADRLLGNDAAAPDGLKPTIAGVGDAQGGTVVLDADGSITFTPTAWGPASFEYTDTDADGDASTVATVAMTVKLPTTITWGTPAAIVYGTTLGAAQLDATASVPGTFVYSPAPGTLLHGGHGQVLEVTFTPADSADYAGATDEVRINVLPAPTTIAWADPADITDGTALGPAQLDARANVPGTFTYVPAAGTILGVGDGQTLAVSFAPADATDYAGGVATVTINVLADPPPGVRVQARSFSGRVRRKVGGVIAVIETALPHLKPSYYSALIDWGDGTVQAGKLARAGAHGFKVSASHKYRMAGSYEASVTISDPQGDRLTEPFAVAVH